MQFDETKNSQNQPGKQKAVSAGAGVTREIAGFICDSGYRDKHANGRNHNITKFLSVIHNCHPIIERYESEC